MRSTRHQSQQIRGSARPSTFSMSVRVHLLASFFFVVFFCQNFSSRFGPALTQFRPTEKPLAALEKSVEYDLDSDDESFRLALNTKMKHKSVLNENTLEKLIDTFEKEYFRQVRGFCCRVHPCAGLNFLWFAGQGQGDPGHRLGLRGGLSVQCVQQRSHRTEESHHILRHLRHDHPRGMLWPPQHATGKLVLYQVQVEGPARSGTRHTLWW